MPRSNHHQRGGRIYPHERNTNDDAELIGHDLDIPNYISDIQQTLRFEMGDKCRMNYRNRIKSIIRYWKTNHQAYFDIGVHRVSHEDLNDPSKYYFGVFDEDIIYSGLNTDFVIKFLMDIKCKSDGNLKSNEDIRKYKDAIIWASKIKNEPLPTAFYEKIERYLKSYKVLHTNAKKDGKVEDKGADPISLTFYKLLLQWAIESNNIFVWFWTLAQWNNMARCASIDPLGFHNFKLGADSIICKYDDSKTKKDGENLSEKNIYANPFSYKECFWTGMAVYCALHSDKIAIDGKLFASHGKEGSASARYQEQLTGLIRKRPDEVSNHIRPDHANAYGIRKGSATYATSGTTAPPSIPSIARRGEWSMGKVLDVYWHFAEPGDHYLGRILSGLDPSNASFGTLPPHWIYCDPMNHPQIKEAMMITYGPIMEKYDSSCNVIALLLRCFASLIYHSDKLLLVVKQYPGHDFNKIMILQDLDLLKSLKQLVTLDPVDGVMIMTTGIPPHIELAQNAKLIFDRCGEILSLLINQSTALIDAVKAAIEEKTFEQGHMSYDRLHNMFEEFKENALKQQKEQLDEMRNEFISIIGSDSNKRASTSTTNTLADTTTGCNMFCYNGRFYDVPEDFAFPKKMNLRMGLNFWFNGQCISETCSIKPYRLIKPSMLPTNALKNEYKLSWKGIYRHLDELEGLPHQTCSLQHLSHDELGIVYEKLVEFLKARFSYCFDGNVDPLIDWNIATWSTRTCRSVCESRGTDLDKAALPQKTRWNSSSGRKNHRKRKKTVSVLYPHRQTKQQTTVPAATP